MNLYQQWNNAELLTFHNQNFTDIDLSTDAEQNNFNTELHFINCRIELFNAFWQLFEKPVKFVNCHINNFHASAACFMGGFAMQNCIIDYSIFDCCGYNKEPNKFELSDCIFHQYVDFFDVYFTGEVWIINNHFKKGTNLGLNIVAPYGVVDGINVRIETNQGNLYQNKA